MQPDGPITPDRFRPDDPDIQQDPYRFYPVLREQAPVLASAVAGQPCWIVSRREDVTRVLMDPATFSSRTTPIGNMLFSDPPEHGRLRRMVADMFTRAAVRPMAPLIEQRAEQLLDACLRAGRCDAVEDFAGPLTVRMIGLMLGIPVLGVERLRELPKLQMEYVLAIRVGRAPAPEARQASEALIAFVSGLIRTGDYEPGHAVAALAGQLAEGALSEEDCAQFATMLLIAGHSTTTNLIGNSIYMLSRRQADLDRLRGDPEFVTAFVEEVLRTRPSFHRNLRITTREVEVAGITIPAGAVVRLLLASANRDRAFYDDPEAF